jgi:hypothetical protein
MLFITYNSCYSYSFSTVQTFYVKLFILKKIDCDLQYTVLNLQKHILTLHDSHRFLKKKHAKKIPPPPQVCRKCRSFLVKFLPPLCVCICKNSITHIIFSVLDKPDSSYIKLIAVQLIHDVFFTTIIF